MTAGEIYVTVLAWSAALGLVAAVIIGIFYVVMLLLAYAALLALTAIEVVLEQVLPALPRAAWILITTLIALLGKAIAAQRARNARGVSIHESEPDWQRRAREEANAEAALARIDGWEAACELLGLSPDTVTKAGLSRAYRKAIRAAHPDLGGSPARAKAVNIARDLIRERLGQS